MKSILGKLRATLLACVVLITFGCSNGDEATSPESAKAPEAVKASEVGEGRLDIVAWAGYVERGETDPKFDWVTSFEEQTDCRVMVKTANTL